MAFRFAAKLMLVGTAVAITAALVVNAQPIEASGIEYSLRATGLRIDNALSIGQQSQELRNLMRSLGVQLERCMLPQVRGRLKRSETDGAVGAAIHLSARCTFY